MFWTASPNPLMLFFRIMRRNTENNVQTPFDWAITIAAYAKGEDSAANPICQALSGPIRNAIQSFFTSDGMDADDILQETLLATLGYIRKNAGFKGDIKQLAVTIARNRCRDLLRWRRIRPHVPLGSLSHMIADRSISPLDEIADREVVAILQHALSNMGQRCRNLLSDFYLKKLSVDDIRQKAGLKSVQAVYYRRMICLNYARKIIISRLSERSPDNAIAPHPIDAKSEVQYD